ncbi:hypothetical protein CC78DRAFT_458854 [Lojkania enalia]|uniref:Rhodopsin domain-containing protein n=1 Tax=Lojkania enalia TaxID=147567 RepID=A0A9P4KDS5_9PLEO|nr:hypothetical protein CC78DRAFT_458854 [Didymosphaeria enalia]
MVSSSSWTPDHVAVNSSQALLNVCISFAILETFFIIAFIFSWYFNSNISHNTKVVFCLILVGYILCFAGVVIGLIKITVAGAGYHVADLRPETIQRMLQLIKAHEVVYVLAIPLPKLAVLCLYFRLFTSKLSHAILYLTGTVVVVTCLFGFISSFANCKPFHAFWDRRVQVQCLMDPMLVFRYYSIPNIATDVIMLAIPLPSLWKLQVGWMTKIGVFLTFATSTLGIVTAVLRFLAFIDADLFDDVTYESISTTSWTIIEPGSYLIAATMPTLRPLIRKIYTLANEFCPITHAVKQYFAKTKQDPTQDTVDTQPERSLHKKPSTKEIFETIGRLPSRQLPLDDYHLAQNSVAQTPRSMDEESMVCADAITHESMARVGRNPDGTLRTWSLQPVQLSPFRTSFFYVNN